MRIFLVHHVTWSVNSICHFFGRRRFDIEDQSTNVAWLSLPSLGESWHHNHHAFPRSAFHGLRRWEIDPSGLLISALEQLGLAWNVVRIAPERQLEKSIAPRFRPTLAAAPGARLRSAGRDEPARYRHRCLPRPARSTPSSSASWRPIPAVNEIPPAESRRARREGLGIFPAPAFVAHARTLEIDGPRGPIALRVIPPERELTGTFLHIHGGGWVVGAEDLQDPRLDRPGSRHGPGGGQRRLPTGARGPVSRRP